MSSYPALGGRIDEQMAINVAEQEHVKSNVSLTLVQLYQTTADKEVLLYIAIVDGKQTTSVTKALRGRPERQRIIASSTAFNVLRKHLLDS